MTHSFRARSGKKPVFAQNERIKKPGFAQNVRIKEPGFAQSNRTKNPGFAQNDRINNGGKDNSFNLQKKGGGIKQWFKIQGQFASGGTTFSEYPHGGITLLELTWRAH